MSFARLLELSLTHPYYADGICPDLSIEPSPPTRRLLANCRCVLKSGPGWVRVFNDPSGLAPRPGDVFQFRLRRENPDFELLTDLTDHAATPAPVYTNAGGEPSGRLSLSSRPERQVERFAWPAAGAECRFKLGGRPLTGPAMKLDVEGAGKGAKARYDEAENVVVVSGAKVGPGAPVAVGYDALPSARGDDFALAEVVIGDDGATRAQGSGDYRIEFRPRTAYWVFDLVTDLKAAPAEFRIVEDPADPQQPLRFTKSAPVELQAVDAQDDPVLGRLDGLPAGARRIRFVSDEPMACRQSPRRNIQLLLGGNRLLAPLPVPAPSQFTTISDPAGAKATRRDACYRIVRHLTR